MFHIAYIGLTTGGGATTLRVKLYNDADDPLTAATGFLIGKREYGTPLFNSPTAHRIEISKDDGVHFFSHSFTLAHAGQVEPIPGTENSKGEPYCVVWSADQEVIIVMDPAAGNTFNPHGKKHRRPQDGRQLLQEEKEALDIPVENDKYVLFLSPRKGEN